MLAGFLRGDKRLTSIYAVPLPSVMSSQKCQRRPTPAPLRTPLRAVRILVEDASSQPGAPAILRIEPPKQPHRRSSTCPGIGGSQEW